MSRTELVEQLKEDGIKVEEDTLSNVINLVHELNLDNDDLVNEWQSFALNKKFASSVRDDSTIDQPAFRAFSKHLKTRSQSARCAKKTKQRFGVHSKQSLDPLIETMATPMANRTTQRRFPQSGGRQNSNDKEALFDAFMSMGTPAKAGGSSTSTISSSAVKADRVRGRTPMSTPSLMQSPAPSGSVGRGQRSGDKAIETLNAALPINNDVAAVRMEVIVPEPDGQDYPWRSVPVNDAVEDPKRQRFMMEDVHSKQRAMRERIEYIGRFLMAQVAADVAADSKGNSKGDDDDDVDIDEEDRKADDVALSALDEPSQRECYFLGRVMNDGDSAETDKMTTGNVVMEGVDGKRARLNLSKLDSVSLFPGQIVVVRGGNDSGKEVMVSAVYQNAGFAMRKRTDSRIGGMRADGAGSGVLEVLIACGPFTGRESVEFAGSTMHGFAERVNERRPNVVVLMGPFTDSENERIKKGEIECSMEEQFENLLAAFLQQIDPSTKVVVVPSTKDVHHFTAFPQRRYRVKAGCGPNVHFLPNPAELRLNNVRVGLCSADLLYDFCRIGLTKKVPDRLLSLMTHCIDQQSFYPLQPAVAALRMDANEHRALYIHDKLDLLIMPSALKQFAKIHHETNTVCINPSFLTRINRGGTFASINIVDSDNYDVDDYTQRVRVDVLRI